LKLAYNFFGGGEKSVYYIERKRRNVRTYKEEKKGGWMTLKCFKMFSSCMNGREAPSVYKSRLGLYNFMNEK